MLINQLWVLKDDLFEGQIYPTAKKGEALNDNTLNSLSPIQLEEILEEYELIENIRKIYQVYIVLKKIKSKFTKS